MSSFERNREGCRRRLGPLSEASQILDGVATEEGVGLVLAVLGVANVHASGRGLIGVSGTGGTGRGGMAKGCE
jgi:hypothetical protein